MKTYLQAFCSSRATQLTVAVVVSAGISAMLTYRVTKKRLDEEYRKIVDVEILEARRYFDMKNKTGAFATPDLTMREVGLEAAAEALQTYQGHGAPDEDLALKILQEETRGRVTVPYHEPSKIKINVVDPGNNDVTPPGFRTPTDHPDPNEFNYAAELNRRDTSKPYLITHDEFAEGSYQKGSITFYVEDTTLADEQDASIDDIEKTVGFANLERFGEGSNDEEIVYVRNEKLAVDFEVVRDEGSFAAIVHGISPGGHG